MRAVLAVALCALALAPLAPGPLAPAGAAAQEVRVELSAGAAIGNYTSSEAGLDVLPRPAFGALVEVWPTRSLAGYAGFTRSTFGCNEGFCAGRDVSMTSQGLVAGARWSPGIPWARVGLAVQRLTIRGGGSDESSDPGLGIEAAVGLELPVGRQFRVRPGIRYLRHDASIDRGEGHVSMLALDVGIAMDVASF